MLLTFLTLITLFNVASSRSLLHALISDPNWNVQILQSTEDAKVSWDFLVCLKKDTKQAKFGCIKWNYDYNTAL